MDLIPIGRAAATTSALDRLLAGTTVDQLTSENL
jgi:hypothetical protein